MGEKPRVVITGLGVVSSTGNNVTEFAQSLRDGKSGAGVISHFDPAEFIVKIACEVKGFNPEQYLDPKIANRTDPIIHYGVAAGIQAIEESGIEFDPEFNDRTSIILGTGVGGISTTEAAMRKMVAQGPTKVGPNVVPNLMPDATTYYLSHKYHITGNTKSTNSACSSAADAIRSAYQELVCGDSDVVLTGGMEAAIIPLSVSGFANMRAITRDKMYIGAAHKASRPFDKARSGFVMGEGSGMLVLETLEHAKARNAPHIYAEIVGHGATSDAYKNIVMPEPTGRGARRAMEITLETAYKNFDIHPEAVDYVNAHGTSTPLNDKMETAAIRGAFGDVADKLWVSSTKSMHGHGLGAAGGIEMVATLLAMRDGFVPPTINYDTPDPECDLNYVPNQAIEKQIDVALTNSFGFGGHNLVLAVRRWTE